MIFVDASAIIAIIARESDADSLAARLGQAGKIYVSPIVVYEAALGLARIGNLPVAQARAVLADFLEEIAAETLALNSAISDAALDAFDRFGKGRHIASLNLGDCFAYACARALDAPLLFKGSDFPHTDIAAA
ncbi:MAG TPA: type II toxin-antitoxin system VapC family toxin [Rhizomicrobium sp.]|jgi:ribonuclease VapC